MADRVSSFPPVADPATARILILGSMPGEASLSAGRYYAHPRNQFWPIAGALFGASPDLPYEHRLQRLKDAGIALWDVLESCQRCGSLDADIDLRSARINDFERFLERHPLIAAVAFNGGMAERLFRRDVAPHVRALRQIRLPSTSPAHASLGAAGKLERWHAALQPILASTVEAHIQPGWTSR
ncbi:DNA-deoxyinosine glycosylase [Methyloversatilis thermotolerans]|uniref:DNA-deoxyinosine glycosylase n=1 Tax=Methyloversatilis thermotolerans TaxID=1346290 RepID=UPI00036FEFA6|nr:DNA-deoxyinosine glycosylase [Methyloversatilis thermotolerans]